LIWLLYILGNQRGHDAVIWTAAFLLCLGLACWIYGTFCGPLSSRRTRVISLVAIVLIIFVGARWFLAGKFTGLALPGQTKRIQEGIAWQPFSTKALEELLGAGKPVFLDFTADWCISCKFNERTAIEVPAVREAFEKDGIVPMKADWTNANPEITAALKKFGRVGVPFYVLYPRGRSGEPIILPEILTENILLEALSRAR
jgi:thiol:disulfide interchange protein DsbD